jgi:GT2 family glycosyltransferase
VDVADVSVIVRTIGRPVLLKAALESLARCNPAPAEVLVVDQSDELSSRPVIDEVGLSTARTVQLRTRHRGLAMNEGFRQASHQIVLSVDDDCTVRSDWIAVASRAMLERPDGIISGRVLPAGDNPEAVPSTIVVKEPRDYTGQRQLGVLYSNNMACPRDAVLALGGFDETFGPYATDVDFCYRWLSSGRPLRHVPDFVVWHHDWRSPEELNELYVGYAHGRGMFFAKHLRAGDPRMLRYLAVDGYRGLRSLYGGLIGGVPRYLDEDRGILIGMPRGVWAGLRKFGRAGRLEDDPVADDRDG